MPYTDASMLHCSEVLFVGEVQPHGAMIAEWLSSFGWRTRFISGAFLLDEIDKAGLKLFIIDHSGDDDAALAIIQDIRGLHAFAAGLPILLCGNRGRHLAGANAVLSYPLSKDDTLDMIENWVGPLGDHDFRFPDNARYRLVRMMGMKEADRLFDMFVRSLEQGLKDLEKGGDVRHVAHNVAGIAGMMGYADLNILWSAVSKGEMDCVSEARRKTIAFLRDVA